MNRGVLTGLGPGDAPDIATGDAGGNALLTGGGFLSDSLTPGKVYAVGAYRWVTAYLSDSGTFSWQQSADGTNWASLGLARVDGVQNGSVATWATTNSGFTGSIWSGLVFGKYFRLTSSSTVHGTVLFSTQGQFPFAFLAGQDINTADGATIFAAPLSKEQRPFAYNGSTWDRQRTPTIFKTATATASGDTALWTPAAGKKFRLLRYRIEVTGDAATSGGAEIDIVLRDGATATAHACSLYVPAAGGTLIGGYTTGWVDVGNGQLSSAANAVLNVNLSAALTAGKVRVVACGTEE